MTLRIATRHFTLRSPWLARGAAALLAMAIAAAPGRAHAGVFVSVNIAPPPLPVYVQPAIPGPGYIWTPGYWAWGGDGYYWVPGTWVFAPFAGALWTPGYWGWSSGVYLFHSGYWGRHVGFYGGVNYGYGYGGHGYDGGYWRGGGFYYNRSVNHVTTNITNVYNKTVVNHTTIVNRTSYNGGPRGIAAHATAQQQAWGRERHTAPVAAQRQQRSMARRMPSMRASANHGAPPIATTPRAGAFDGHGTAPAPMAAHESRYTPQRDGALRSSSFAPHADTATRAGAENRYTPAAANRGDANPNGHASPRDSRAPQRYQSADDGYRGASNRPQGERSQAYRPAPRNAQPAYRPEYARPAQRARSAAPRGHSEPAARQERRDDKHH